MQNFKKIGENVAIIKKYAPLSKTGICDFSAGVKYIWREHFASEYVEIDDTLVLKETTKEYKNAFYYPVGKSEILALDFIDEYVKENGIDLAFCCLNKEQVDYLQTRYKKTEVIFDRNWSDYIYDAEAFASFKGKKYSGQRNHVNKFKSLYKNFVYKRIEENDLPLIKSFINEYESGRDINFWIEKAEQDKLLEYVANLYSLGQIGACIYVENKIVGITCGEIVNDMLIVHVEKALKEYNGIYPTLAQAFSKDVLENFGIKEINREEDCGDLGLRTSKTQYHPIEIRHKYFLKTKN